MSDETKDPTELEDPKPKEHRCGGPCTTVRLDVDPFKPHEDEVAKLQEEIDKLQTELEQYKLMVSDFDLEKVNKSTEYTNKQYIESLTKENDRLKKMLEVVNKLDAVQLRDANSKLRIRVGKLQKELWECRADLDTFNESDKYSNVVSNDQAVYVRELMKLVDKIEEQTATARHWEAKYKGIVDYADYMKAIVSDIRTLLAKRYESTEKESALDKEAFTVTLSDKVESLWAKLCDWSPLRGAAEAANRVKEDTIKTILNRM